MNIQVRMVYNKGQHLFWEFTEDNLNKSKSKYDYKLKFIFIIILLHIKPIIIKLEIVF